MSRLLFFLPLSGCIILDGLLPFHKGIPCNAIAAEDCNVDDQWDAVCDACEDYANGPWWSEDYSWRPKTLDTIESIRPVQTDIQRVPFETQDGLYSIDAWFLPSHGDNPALAESTILYNYGRFAGIEHYAPRVRFFHELGYNVYVWDYRGYGHSLPIDASQEAAPPQTADWMVDASQAFRQAQELAPDKSKLIVYGMSVGAMPAGEMGDLYDTEICALMLEAAFNSISAKVETNLSLSMPGSLLTSGLIENEIKLSDITTPTLMIHGDSDDRVHINESKRLFDALPEDLPKSWVVFENAGHGLGGEGGIPEQGLGAYGEVLQNFLQNNAPNCLTP